jgi:hypothetical protein
MDMEMNPSETILALQSRGADDRQILPEPGLADIAGLGASARIAL